MCVALSVDAIRLDKIECDLAGEQAAQLRKHRLNFIEALTDDMDVPHVKEACGNNRAVLAFRNRGNGHRIEGDPVGVVDSVRHGFSVTLG